LLKENNQLFRIKPFFWDVNYNHINQ
jgi:hypothetical protein